MRFIEALLRHERAIPAACLVAMMLLAWAYLWHGAGMGMSAREMTLITLFPHAHPEPMSGMEPPATTWLTLVAMWWVMMIAMMTPSAAPLILLYSRVMRQSAPAGGSPAIHCLLLVAGYFAVWLAFSTVASGLQRLLERTGLLSAMMLWSKSAWLSATVLLGAGLYQLSPLKRTCLAHCRGPVGFLTRHARAGRFGAFRLGVEHGAWCVGCCWMLMALLFVGGVMNVVWIALLGLLVLAEKVAPMPAKISAVTGVVLIGWGIATVAVSVG